MRIGIDAMGGDGAPAINVNGALLALREILDAQDELVLVGDEARIQPLLPADESWKAQVSLQHASQQIGMDEPPVDAVRQKPDSSMAVLAELHKAGKVDAIVSAGNTGACVAAAQMRLRRLTGVHRPGIAIVTPTLQGPVAIADVGANVNCRPQHLHQYGVMSCEYMQAICGVDQPRVGLLSIGEEDSKGNLLVKETARMMREDENLNFVGNVEGRDIFRDVCDIVICEGFVGNVVLKLMEGMAMGIIRGLLQEVAATMPDKIDVIQGFGRQISRKYDFNEYGGAPLLGVAGIVIICHGASNERGIMNAVRVAKEFRAHRLNERITDLLAR
jgi:glycerol-3-phosphate acyltransferase PlsX